MGFPTLSATKKFTSGTLEELRLLAPIAKSYNMNTDDSDNIIAFAEAKKTLVGAATMTKEVIGNGFEPRSPNFGITPFPGIDNSPQAYSDKDWITLTTTTINTDGLRLSDFPAYMKVDVTGDVSVLWKPASIGQTMKMRIESSTSNYLEYTWISTSTELVRYTAMAGSVADGGSAVKVGNPDLNSVVSVFVTTSSGTSRFYDFASANNKRCFIGTILTVDFDNITEFDIKNAKKYSDYGEFTTMRGANATEFGMEIDLSISTMDPVLMGAIEGKSWKRKLTNQSKIIASASTNNLVVNSSNYVVLNANLDTNRFQRVSVSFDGTPVILNLVKEGSNLKFDECFFDNVTNPAEGRLYVSPKINGQSTVNKAVEVVYSFNEMGNVLIGTTGTARMFYLTLNRKTNEGIKTAYEYPWVQFQIVDKEQKAKDPTVTYKIKGKAYFGKDPLTGEIYYEKVGIN